MSKLINRIMRMLENGMTEEEIKEEVNANKKTITKCKREFDARNNIKTLIEQGRIEDAQNIANELKIDAMDKNTLFVLLELAIKRRDIKQGEDTLNILLRRQLNYEEQKRALYLGLELEPDNTKFIDALIGIARKQEDYSLENKLLERKSEIKRRKLMDRRKNMLNEIKLSDFEEPKKTLGNLQKARILIYQGTDIQETLEEINKMLEGEDEITRVLVQAELLTHVGFRKRAEILLKRHMKKLDANSQIEEIRSVKQAIELAKSSKTVPYNWEGFWCGREKIPSAIGEDDGAR